MANVMFKRGLHNSLPTTAEDGVFYLTSDTHRLYVGQGSQLVELNKSIEIVSKIEDLPTSNVEAGQFYYIAGPDNSATNTHKGNILAVVTQVKANGEPVWVQVNPDTNTDTGYDAVSGLSVSDSSVDSTNKKIDYTITLNRKHVNSSEDDTTTLAPITATFSVKASEVSGILTATNVSIGSTISANNKTVTIKPEGVGANTSSSVVITAGSNVSFSGSNNNFTIAADDTTYELSSSSSGSNGAQIKLTDNGGESSSVTVTGGTDINVSQASNTITVAHADVSHTNSSATAVEASNGTTYQVVESVSVNAQGHVTDVKTKNITASDTTYTAKSIGVDSTNASKLTFTIENENDSNDTSSATSGEVLYWTYTNGHGSNVTVKNQGTAGQFYTKAEVDEQLQGINAMTYKGTVGSGDTNATVQTLPTSGVAVGDTYLVSAVGTYAGITTRVGDLLIATGTETNGVITSNLGWTHVSAGAAPDTTYTFSVNNDGTIQALPSTDPEGTIAVAKVTTSGENISSSVENNTITISHGAAGTTKTTKGNNSGITAALGYSGKFKVPTISIDENGHVSSLTEKEIQLPASDDTTYSIGTTTDSKIVLTNDTDVNDKTYAVLTGGTAITTVGSTAGITINHDDALASGTANTLYGSSASTTPSAGGKIKIPNIKVNGQGHVTSVAEQEITLPVDKDTQYSLRPSVSSVTTNVGTYTIKIGDSNVNSSDDDTATTITLTSDTLSISKPTGSTNGLKVDLEWGTF